MDLAQKHCVPCEGGTPPLTQEEVAKFLTQILGWTAAKDGKSVSKEFTFKDFKESMRFVNKVAEIAEAEGHHPDISIFYNKVKLELSTHAIGGLSENDFIVASRVDKI